MVLGLADRADGADGADSASTFEKRNFLFPLSNILIFGKISFHNNNNHFYLVQNEYYTNLRRIC